MRKEKMSWEASTKQSIYQAFCWVGLILGLFAIQTDGIQGYFLETMGILFALFHAYGKHKEKAAVLAISLLFMLCYALVNPSVFDFVLWTCIFILAI